MAFCDFLRDKDKDKDRNLERDRHPDDSFDVSSAFIKGTPLLTPYFKRRLKKINAAALLEFFEALEKKAIPPSGGDNIEELILTSGLTPDKMGACLRELMWLPEVAVLDRGFSEFCIPLLGNIGEPVRKIDADFNVGDIVYRQSVLVLPTGSLDGFGRSLEFKRRLEEYVRAGGRLIVLCQFRGEDYGALPLSLGGFGWQEDQSCHNASMRIVMDHPVLSGQDSELMDISCDGFFTQWPAASKILLRRAAHDRPCLLVYPFEKGLVIAGTMFIDWAFAHQQPTLDEITLMRDMIGFAKCSTPPAEYDPDDTQVTLSVPVPNPTSQPAASTRFTLIQPDKTVLDRVPDFTETFQQFNLRRWAKDGASIVAGALRFKGTGSNYNAYWYHKTIYPRNTNPSFKVRFSIETDPSVETNFHICTENTASGSTYRRHGITCKNGRIAAQSASAEGWRETALMDGLSRGREYTVEIVFNAGGSSIFLYRSNEVRPSAPSHFLDSTDWDPRLRSYIYQGESTVLEILIQQGDNTVFSDTFTAPHLSDNYMVSLSTTKPGKMVMIQADDQGYESHFYGRDFYNRRSFPSFQCEVKIKDAVLDSEFTVCTETDGSWGSPNYHRHGVVFRSGYVVEQQGKGCPYYGKEIFKPLQSDTWYTMEIEFEIEKSRLFFYPSGTPKPAEPQGVFTAGGWTPRFHCWLRRGEAEVRDISVKLIQDPRITVSKILQPGSAESLEATFPGRLNQGIWGVDADLLDANGAVLWTHYSLNRFSVDNFNNIAAGFSYKSVPMQFSVTSELEDILPGTDNLFTAHVWSNDNVNRTLTVVTYFNNNTFPEQAAITLKALGYQSVQRSLPPIGIGGHTFWVEYRDENGTVIGKLSKIFRILTPQVQLEIATGVETLSAGGKFPVMASLKTNQDIDIPVNVLFQLLNPANRSINERMYEDIIVKLGQETAVPAELTLPDQLEPGSYQVIAVVSYQAMELARKGVYSTSDLKGEVSGFLLDAVTLRPMTGATMSLDWQDNFIPLNESGYYTASAPKGYHNLIARAPNRQEVQTRVNIVSSQNTQLKSILLPPLYGEVTLTLCDTVSGKAIEGVTVNLSNQSLKTDAMGNGSFKKIPDGFHNLQCIHPDYQSFYDWRIQVLAGRNLSIIPIYLTPLAGALSGRVINGVTLAPIPNARVWGDSIPEVKTDEKGKFVLTGIPEGRRGFYSEAEGYQRKYITADAAAGRETQVGDFYLVRYQGIISGQVLDIVTRSPIPNATLRGSGFNNLAVDTSGKFITGALNEGIQWISATAAGYNETSLYTPVFADRTTSIPHFFLTPLTGKVTGTVLDSVTGVPIPNAEITLDNLKTVSDAAGSFVLDNVPSWSRWLRAISSTADRSLYPWDIYLHANVFPGKTSDLGPLYLVPALCTVSGRIEDAVTGKPVVGSPITIAGVKATSGENGAFSMKVPTGKQWGSAQSVPAGRETHFYCDFREGIEHIFNPLRLPDPNATAPVPITCKIIDSVTGLPLPGVEIMPDSLQKQKGRLIQESNIYGGDNAAGYRGTYIVTGDAGWTDGTFSVRTFAEDNDGFGFIFRYRDASNFYRLFFLEEGGPFRRLECWKDNKYTVIAQDNFCCSRWNWFQVKIEAVKDRIRVYIDGRLVFDVSDSTHTTGKIGLMCYGQYNQHFTDIEFTGPSGSTLFKEDFLTGLQKWTVVDDGTIEKPSKWKVESPSKVITDSSGMVSLSVTPGDHRLYADKEGYAAIDPNGKELVSLSCHGKEKIQLQLALQPTSAYLEGKLSDSITGLPVPDATVWIDDEDTATGGFIQYSSIYSSTPGTYTGTRIVSKTKTWTDYLFTVDLYARSNGTIELLFRYQDEKNYCRVVMCNQGEAFVRLESILNGKTTILDTKSETYPTWQWFGMKITIVGTLVTAQFKNKTLFSMNIPGPSSGGIGMGCNGQPNQWFRRIKAATPQGAVLLEESTDYTFNQWDIIDTGDAYRPSSWVSYPEKRCKTTSAGLFSLSGITPGDRYIRFSKTGYGVFSENILARYRAFPGKTHRYALAASCSTGTMNGIVRHAVTLAPLAGVFVRTADSSVSATTGADGKFVLKNIKPGTAVQIHAALEGFSTGDWNNSGGQWIVQPGGKGTADIYLKPQYCTVEIEVRDQVTGSPINGVTSLVSGTSLTAVSRESGVLNFQRFPLENRSVSLNAGDYRTLGYNEWALMPNVVPGGKIKWVTYMKPTLGTLSGIITDIAGDKPIEGVQVLLNSGIASGETNKTGRFEMDIPEGKYRVYLVYPGYNAGSESSPAFDLYINGNRDTNIKTAVVPTGGRISGVFKDSISGVPIPGAQFFLDSGWINTESSEQGQVDMSVPPGAHSLYIRAANYSSQDENGFFLSTFIAQGQNLDISGFLTPTLRNPIIQFSDLPENLRLKSGETTLIPCRVKNTGNSAGTAKIKLLIPGIGSFDRDQWVDPGEEVEIAFPVPLPDDLLESTYQEACFILNKDRRFISLQVEGLKIKVVPKLDKPLFLEGETAKLTLEVENATTFSMKLYAVVRYQLFSKRTPVITLAAAQKSPILVDIPVTHNNGKLFYGIYSDSNRALVLDTLYIYPAQPNFLVQCDKPVYRSGDSLKTTITLLTTPPLKNVKASLVSPETMETLAGVKTIDLDVNVPKEVEILVPLQLETGSYTFYIQSEEAALTAFYPVDIKGMGVLINRVELNRDKYDFTDQFKADFDIESEEPFKGDIDCRWLSPQNVQLSTKIQAVTIKGGLNRVSITNELKTAYSGSHSFKYYLYEANDTQTPVARRLVASGARLFDTAGNTITAVIADKDTFKVGETAKTNIIMFGQGTSTLQVICNTKELLNTSVTLNGRTVYPLDVKVELAGRNVVLVSLKGQVQSSQKLVILGKS